MKRETNYGAHLRTEENGARWYGNSFWSHPWYVRDVPCECGGRHTVRLNQEADTYFSWPGRATCRGKTRRGFISDGETNGVRGSMFYTVKI